MSEAHRTSLSRTTPEDVENAATQKLATKIAPRIQELERQSDALDAGSVRPRSALSADDELTKPYQLSHAAWRSLTHATDSLRALRHLAVRETEQGYEVYSLPYAYYPLLRSAFENACTTIWLLGPASRNTRLVRRMRLLVTDGFNRDEVSRLTSQPATAEQDRMRFARELAASRGLDAATCQKRTGYASIVTGAAEAVASAKPTDWVAVWRALSGLTHGDEWSATSLTDMEEVSVSSDGTVLTMRVTTSIENLTNLADLTTGATEAALRRFNQLRQPG